jgi:iron complex transport system substrate-binding protein
MVEIAAGINGLSSRREPSRQLNIDEIAKFNPDKLILMPCGFDVQRTIREAKYLDSNNYKWKNPSAVKIDEIYAANANSYFSKPGSRRIFLDYVDEFI